MRELVLEGGQLEAEKGGETGVGGLDVARVIDG